MKGKVAVVTGASGGLGRAICMALATHGAKIVALDKDQETTSFAAQWLYDQGYHAVTADVANPASVASAFADIEREIGGVDILINTAGISHVADPLEMAAVDWERVIAVNLNGAFYCARESAISMRRRGGGCIVNITSVAGLVAIRGRSAYTAAKHGLIGLTRALAFDLAPSGIRVNAVAPGVTRTEMTMQYIEDPQFQKGLEDSVALKRVALPEDIADAVAFLCSPGSSYINGIVLPVDGGFLCEKSFASSNVVSFSHAKRTDEEL